MHLTEYSSTTVCFRVTRFSSNSRCDDVQKVTSPARVILRLLLGPRAIGLEANGGKQRAGWGIGNRSRCDRIVRLGRWCSDGNGGGRRCSLSHTSRDATGGPGDDSWLAGRTPNTSCSLAPRRCIVCRWIWMIVDVTWWDHVSRSRACDEVWGIISIWKRGCWCNFWTVWHIHFGKEVATMHSHLFYSMIGPHLRIKPCKRLAEFQFRLEF